MSSHRLQTIRVRYLPPDGRKMTSQLFDGDIRRIVVGDAECWHQFIIVPRSRVLATIRRLRAVGRAWNNISRWDYWPGELVRPGGNGGPGEAFAGEPWRMRSSRRWLVIYQRGGLDV